MEDVLSRVAYCRSRSAALASGDEIDRKHGRVHGEMARLMEQLPDADLRILARQAVDVITIG